MIILIGLYICIRTYKLNNVYQSTLQVIAVEVDHSKVHKIDDLLFSAGYTLLHKLGNGCDGSSTCDRKAQDHIYVLSSLLEK